MKTDLLQRRDLLLLLTAATLAGCATRDAPPRRLYGLTGTPPLPLDAQPGQDCRAWVLNPQIALPELLDRDEILVADGSAGLRPWPEARWAEPLRDALPRVLAEDLGRLRQPYPVSLGTPQDRDAESLR
ncbi:MAG TPA: ABC-type transport auxiliary lipoprotein family protein, partial [Roseateles sp.]|uniref:ABC-type transport auxiliary lipoprotein family protein n=1 Tax=Roseateles sp. TaxID=1971397 RepID=UPI002EDB07F0